MRTVVIYYKYPTHEIVDGVINLITPFEYGIYTTLTALCKFNTQFSYQYIKGNKFPFEYKGYTFNKIEI